MRLTITGILLVATASAYCVTPIDYNALSYDQAQAKRYELMQGYCRSETERAVLKLSYETVLWLHKYHGKDRVGMADLMAHGLQESHGAINAIDKGYEASWMGTVGKDLWTFHSKPSNDLLGWISWSVWQSVTPHILKLGANYSPEMKQLYDQYVTAYGATIWNFKQKMKEKEGEAAAQKKYLAMVEAITETLKKQPGLNALVAADIIGTNYDSYGRRKPDAVRSFFWLQIQKGLRPDKWLNEVRFDDDVPPSAENDYTDNNARKRGDYGKQVVLGNFYNDRGIVFWLAAAGDEAGVRELVAAWHDDPARLTKKDYQLLEQRGHLNYAAEHPQLYEYILSILED